MNMHPTLQSNSLSSEPKSTTFFPSNSFLRFIPKSNSLSSEPKSTLQFSLRPILKSIIYNPYSDQKGFTIIELLFVMVIIGILAGITLISYAGVAIRAQSAITIANARSIRDVAEIYYVNNKYYPSDPSAFTSGLIKLPSGLSVISFDAELNAANGTKSFKWQACGSDTSSPVGGKVVYWDYLAGNADSSVSVGDASIDCVNTD